MKAVIDTNIWISSLINPSKSSIDIIDEWRKDRFSVLISEEQLLEIYEVLIRPKFLIKYKISEKETNRLVHLIKEKAVRVTLKGNIHICRDPDDNIIIETAIRGKAKYVVTGDKDILDDGKVSSFLSKKGVSVVSTRDFIDIIGKY